MNISVKEFRQMVEDHAAELRQSQDDFNEMCDHKEAEIKRLELRLEATQDAFREYRDRVAFEVAKMYPSDHTLVDLVENKYDDLLDGLDGY